MPTEHAFEYPRVIREICDLGWRELTSDDMVSVAWAYYYFSIQFRESLRAARDAYPADEKLMQLEHEECDTANLSPWPGVADLGERMNHDEYMRRTLELTPIAAERARFLHSVGETYLEITRGLDPVARAASIASYEDGGLESVFAAILEFDDWNNDLLQSFEHFLAEHVRFDSDPEQGHGALSRHIGLDDSILPLWRGFRNLLVQSVPALTRAREFA